MNEPLRTTVHFDRDADCFDAALSKQWFRVKEQPIPGEVKRGEAVILVGPTAEFECVVDEIEHHGGYLLVSIVRGRAYGARQIVPVVRGDPPLPAIRSSAAYPFARR